MNSKSNNNSSSGNSSASTKQKRKSKGIAPGSAISHTQAPTVPKYHLREPGFKEAYTEYYDDSLANYIYGLYHPDVVYKEGLNIKYPAPVPVPTTSFCFKDTFTIQPNAQGNFCLVWQPNYLVSTGRAADDLVDSEIAVKDYYMAHVVYNNTEDLTGNGTLNSGWRYHGFNAAAQNFDKYRLTSACIKVKYTGKVLDQSGCLAACAAYASIPCIEYCVPNGTSSDVNVNTSSIMKHFWFAADFDTIRQGQWAETVSLVSEPEGVACVYLPTDPLSHVFLADGRVADQQQHLSTYLNTAGVSAWLPGAATLSYLICGYGISSTASCITVETYYNYEIIVYPQQMPYFRPSQLDARLIARSTKIVDAMRSVGSAYGGVTHTKSHEAPSIVSRIRGALRSAWQYAGDIAPALLKLGKLLL